MRRPLAILLSFILVIGVFVGVAFLVIPELIDAVSIVISSLTNGLDQLVAFESTADYSKIPFGEQLSQIDIDFLELKDNLNEWLNQLGTTIMDTAASAFGSVVATAVDFAIGLVFSIYILANKEKLKVRSPELSVYGFQHVLPSGAFMWQLSVKKTSSFL